MLCFSNCIFCYLYKGPVFSECCYIFIEQFCILLYICVSIKLNASAYFGQGRRSFSAYYQMKWVTITNEIVACTCTTYTTNSPHPTHKIRGSYLQGPGTDANSYLWRLLLNTEGCRDFTQILRSWWTEVIVNWGHGEPTWSTVKAALCGLI